MNFVFTEIDGQVPDELKFKKVSTNFFFDQKLEKVGK